MDITSCVLAAVLVLLAVGITVLALLMVVRLVNAAERAATATEAIARTMSGQDNM